jgi:DNA-binding PadR family transcriptional regulator
MPQSQLYRLLQAKEQGHKVDENTILPTLKRLKEKTFVKSTKKEVEVIRILT